MPKRIGKYELGKTLGTGTFSKVKYGSDTESNAAFAIKIIDKSQLAKEHMEEQLKREIAVMKLLKHDNIVQLKEVLQTQKHIYLILELITGGELFDRIVAAKKFDEPTARKYFQQLIMGIYYCHQQGIAHRDLKPENLLLDGNDNLKISDFGLSNLQRGGAGGGGTLLQTVCGTPNYVAPEVLKEKGYNGITADIWSCGVILFVMLAGYLPFDDPNMNALFNKIERGDYRMARHFSEPIKDIISKMLVIEPEKRATLDDLIAHPWFRESFDTALLDRAKGHKVSVSGAQVQGAVREVGEQTGTSDKPSGESCAGLDAFDIISRLTAGNLNPLTTNASALVKKSTRFAIKLQPSETMKALSEQLTKLKGNPKSKEGSSEIKGFLNASKGLMTYIITVLPTCAGDLTLVEFRRGRGDTLDYHEFYRSVIKSLLDASIKVSGE
ncbi:CBL-interacting protein kinase 23 [Diplonema papillatum]|nr:CBL-interacting protein kinase 23 [Diplonema papillatum]